MSHARPIHSAANPLVKRVRRALRGTERSVLVLEGERLVAEALAQGHRPEVVLLPEEELARARELADEGIEVRTVTASLLGRLSGLRAAPGVLALLPAPPPRGFDELPDAPDLLVVVVAGVADPGNLGALARTAEAAGSRALVVVDGGCRPWNPKALRGSMGSLLRLPVFEAESAEAAWDALAARGCRHVLARTRGGSAPAATDWSGRVALWLTAETGAWSAGLEARAARALAEARAGAVTISLAPGVESLNVAAAAAVLLFSAGRVRGREEG